MTKLLALAAASLMLGGCHRSPAQQAVQQNADALQADLENQADAMEAMANNAADANAADAMRNAADDLAGAGNNVAMAADARIDNLH